MKPKYTKGPWKVSCQFGGATEIKSFHTITDSENRLFVALADTRASANLIAAAPEMYELLHAIWAKTDPSKDPKTCRAIANLLDRIDETIKARGES
jgi:hypothetical protein